MSMFTPSRNDLLYILNHVFLPPKLPQKDEGDDARCVHDIALASLAHEAAVDFLTNVSTDDTERWSAIMQMLGRLKRYTEALNQDDIVADITSMNEGDVLVLHIRAQNAGLIIRKLKGVVRFEVFEVSPPPEAVMKTTGKLICSYPGPAVDIPLDVATDPSFLQNLASFLVQMDVDELDALPTTKKAGSVVPEERSTAHPRYISELLMGILLALGKEANISRITKRIADDVLWKSAFKPWRRSPLWLVIRVALQTSLPAIDIYKQFLLSFQTKLLWLFYEHDLPSDFIFCARAKTARRAYKLGSLTPGPLLQEVQDVSEALEELMQRRWNAVKAEHATLPSFPSSSVNFLEDTNMTLPNSRAYLTEVLSRNAPPLPSPAPFQPSEFPRLKDTFATQSFSADALCRALEHDRTLALADFEDIVQNSLEQWVSSYLSHPSTACRILGSCLKQYIFHAESAYDSNPEDQSIMFLTILDLWVALDKLAIADIPLLAEYSPEIPGNIIHPLILHEPLSIHRAAVIELYLRSRHERATEPSPIFSKQTTSETFSVRFFDMSPLLQNTKSLIEAEATRVRDEKKRELREQNAQVEQSLARAASMQHEHSSGPGSKKQRKARCTKCKLEKTVRRLTVHEWPLPSRTLEAKAVIFELNCPAVYVIWRDWTYAIIRDFCLAQQKQVEAKQFLTIGQYEPLQAYSSVRNVYRVTLASDSKSFLQAHYKDIKLPAKESSVCVANGLHLRLYDRMNNEWVSSPPKSSDLWGFCTLSLPKKGPYSTLQYAVAHTAHTSNEIVSSQAKCPNDLSIHEYMAFLALRSGPLLQWLNIVREMRARTLSFHRAEIHILLMQAAWQLGPLAGETLVRTWHEELYVSAFGLLLVEEASSLIEHARVGWSEVMSIRTAVLLVSRLLGVSPDDTVCDAAYVALRTARTVTLHWVRELGDRIHMAVSDKERHDFRLQLCEVAATCRVTFDVDPLEHLPHLLCLAEDAAAVIECSIALNIHTPSDTNQMNPALQGFLSYDRRLSHRLEPFLSNSLLFVDRSLDIALGSILPSYRPGIGQWKRSPAPNSRWFSRNLFARSFSSWISQTFHYNILTGLFLLDGVPIDRLPQNIASHPTYTRLFGQNVLDVVPSDMIGMQFATRYLVHDYQIHFHFDQASRALEIRAKSRKGNVYLIIPHDRFLGDFPKLFVSEYVHFLDLSTGRIEFRALENSWDAVSILWTLSFSIPGKSTMTSNLLPSSCLLDPHSRAFKRLSGIFRRLEYSEYLHITYRHDSTVAVPVLTVELPRFRLSFFLNDQGDFESLNLPGMVIDQNQSSGTMIGLQSQLVLRQRRDSTLDLPRSRHVIIPQGQIKTSISGDNDRVTVNIDTHTNFERRLRWHDYGIDEDLGCLVGSVELTSHLYRIYLHAVCSQPLPDPLTGQTGTECALRDLRSAACFSFQQLEPLDIELLLAIQSLTPRRDFYPAGMRSMQTVTWNPDIPFLIQHSAFEIAVRDILDYARSLDVLLPNSSRCPDLTDSITDENFDFLRERAARREVLEVAVVPSTCHTTYISRACPTSSADFCAVVTAASKVAAQSGGLYRDTNYTMIYPLFDKWKTVVGPASEVPFSYNKTWMHFDLSKRWISLYNQLRSQADTSAARYKLLFSLSSMAYASSDLRQFVAIFLAFVFVPKFRTLHPPSHEHYDLSTGIEPKRDQIRSLILSASKSLDNSPAKSFASEVGSTKKKLQRMRQTHYEQQRLFYAEVSIDSVLAQWPSGNPHAFFDPHANDWFDITKATSLICNLFKSVSHNRELHTHFSAIQEVLLSHFTRIKVDFSPSFNFSPHPVHVPYDHLIPTITWDTLFCRDVPAAAAQSSLSDRLGRQLNSYTRAGEYETVNCSSLGRLSTEFQNDDTQPIYRLYGERLDLSRRALQDVRLSRGRMILPPTTTLLDIRDQCNAEVERVFCRIRHLLSPSTLPDSILCTAGLWPRIHPGLLLRCMASTSNHHLSTAWKSHLALLAEVMMNYQFSRRLLSFAQQHDVEGFFLELDNYSVPQMGVEQYSDWLLVQLDGNFLARPLQLQVAQEMISPSSKASTTLQFNMGEGKSSVIVPLVAAALADSFNLSRIVVLKSLARQMFQTLVGRISGLANRRIFFLPFSRQTPMTDVHARLIRDLLHECARVRGVLVTQPEHILSFKLMRVDLALRSTPKTAAVTATLQELNGWLSNHARDVIDESDEVLHVRYQLIYTSGDQRALDDNPDRWTTTQQVFDRIRRHTMTVNAQHGRIDQLETYPGAFPMIRMTDGEGFAACAAQIALDALDGRLDNLALPKFNLNTAIRAAALRFLTERDVSKSDCALVQSLCGNTSSWKGCLLLRGLLAHGILTHIMQLRWRVDYGHDFSRSLMAVPYRAKDVPSLRAEFGHPDVAVGLTCLAYYYSGLTQEQLRECFEELLTLDNPVAEYEKWVRRGGYAKIPVIYRNYKAVNLRDIQRFIDQVVPLFRRNQATIDFFLSNVVFPKQAKEYSHKLGVSAWDLVEDKANVITGFSGTSDSSFLLPTSISQRDPVNQVLTDALVLTYLLQSENEHYVCVRGDDRQTLSASTFLNILVQEEPEIRVLLDIGAQMLELHNEQLVRHWLSLRPEVDAGVFFDDADQLVVLTRDETIDPLLSSSYSQQLGKCVVYLDDAHTRGTDLKLPLSFRAAVTLGPKITKDRLVQGCMRMRKLGYGQSVMFFAPPEIDTRIREVGALETTDSIKVLDIIRWTMHETCADILHHVPHWAQQGSDHDVRSRAERTASISPGNHGILRSAWLQPEARTLEELYGHDSTPSSIKDPLAIPSIRQRLELLSVGASTHFHMDEEQEREMEVMHETEKERAVERAALVAPATHTLDEDVVRLVKTGHISRTSHTFHPLISALRSSSASLQPSYPWSPLLLATRDFMTTTRWSGLTSPTLSEYERPMNWILSFRRKKISDTSLVAISPFEANALLPEIRKSKRVRLHLFEPRVTEAMKPADDLTFYCIPGTMKLTTEWKPPSLTVRCQLNLWSGQLYLDSFETYMRLCSLLGLQHGQPTGSGFLPVPMDNDRFVHKEDRVGEMRDLCLFEESPVPLLKELFAMRRKGTSFLPTQMGRILHGRILTEEDFKDL